MGHQKWAVVVSRFSPDALCFRRFLSMCPNSAVSIVPVGSELENTSSYLAACRLRFAVSQIMWKYCIPYRPKWHVIMPFAGFCHLNMKICWNAETSAEVKNKNWPVSSVLERTRLLILRGSFHIYEERFIQVCPVLLQKCWYHLYVVACCCVKWH